MPQLAQIRRSPPFRRWGRDAIREDRKTQTRRVFGIGRRFYGEAGTIWYKRERPPRGEAGTIWYMGEPLQKAAGSGVHFAKYADDDTWVFLAHGELEWRWQRDALHGMWMPAEAARTFMAVTDVRCEDLHEMRGVHAVAEGISAQLAPAADGSVGYSPLLLFAQRWDEINAKRGFGWITNPRVWVYTFRRLPDVTSVAAAEAYAARKD